jgi:hypothetical protein
MDIMKIYKYEILEVGDFEIEFPVGSTILKFDNQLEIPTIWFLVNPDEKDTEIRKFRLVGTGHDFKMDGVYKYIGTCLQHYGSLVWHLFEKSAYPIKNSAYSQEPYIIV